MLTRFLNWLFPPMQSDELRAEIAFRAGGWEGDA